MNTTLSIGYMMAKSASSIRSTLEYQVLPDGELKGEAIDLGQSEELDHWSRGDQALSWHLVDPPSLALADTEEASSLDPVVAHCHWLSHWSSC